MTTGLAFPTLAQWPPHNQTHFFLSFYIYMRFTCVCSVYWSPREKLLNVFESKLLIAGWAGKASSEVVLYNAGHINRAHQIPHLFYLWLSGLEKRGQEFFKNKTNSKQGIGAELPGAFRPTYFLFLNFKYYKNLSLHGVFVLYISPVIQPGS